ncbi:MAG TPA: hypothetical protein VIJ22_06665, partial [Polyangiaceae bacterium]
HLQTTSACLSDGLRRARQELRKAVDERDARVRRGLMTKRTEFTETEIVECLKLFVLGTYGFEDAAEILATNLVSFFVDSGLPFGASLPDTRQQVKQAIGDVESSLSGPDDDDGEYEPIPRPCACCGRTYAETLAEDTAEMAARTWGRVPGMLKTS